jgi:hypothetical protein
MSGYPALAVLPKLSSPGCPVQDVLSWLILPNSPLSTVLAVILVPSCRSCPGYPVLAVLS